MSTQPMPEPLPTLFDDSVEPVAWIGFPDAMLGLPCRIATETVTARPVSFASTMEGRRFGLQGTFSRRTWQLKFDGLDSRQAQSLGALARDTSNPPRPLRWYPHDAAAGNLFSPQAAEWDPVPTNGQAAGVMKLPDGTLARTMGHIGSGGISIGDANGNSEQILVQPGYPITFGIWALGGITISGFWRDAGGTSITNFTSGRIDGTGWQWLTYTFTPPSTARLVSFQIFGGSAYARPSVSWGPETWDLPPRGCAKAVIHDLSEEPEYLLGGRWLGTLNATVTEVG